MAERFCILDARVADERARWLAAWETSASQSPYAHPTVAGLLAGPSDDLLCALLTGAGGNVLYPFILRRLGAGQHDICSPYGYGGALYWDAGDDRALAVRFWTAFDEWATGQGVVSIFNRGALTGDVLDGPGTARPRTTNYVRDLRCSAGELWSGCAAKVRRNVRRATGSRLAVTVDRAGRLVADFHRVYTSTMVQRGAAGRYYFPRSFFTRLHADLGDRAVYVAATLDGRTVSVDLVLLGRDTAFYFLGGTDRDYSALRPNDLVKVTVMDWLRRAGYSRYVLGGGLNVGDGLERYKRGFAPAGAVPFYTHERVLLPESYAARTAAHRRALAARGQAADTGFFPAYRCPGIPADAVPAEPVGAAVGVRTKGAR